MSNDFIKTPKPYSSSGPVGLNKSDSDQGEKINYPVFCFKHLHKSHNIRECLSKDNKFAKNLLTKIEALTQKTWTEIQLSGRKNGGSEKISKKSLNKTPPNSITEDVRDFLSFYFSNNKGRIIGYRGQDNVFHIVFIDTDLSLYNH